ncbi:MAG: hypothetical protein V3R65_09065 [Acidiferrobacterales bacterium]
MAAGENVMQPSIQEVKQQHQARLLVLPGVVSVGIGRDNKGELAIVVGLDKVRADTEAEIHKTLGDTPVIVQIVGTIKPLQP